MKILFGLSLILNLLFGYWLNARKSHSPNSSNLDDGYSRQEFSAALAIDLYSSVGTPQLLESRQDRSSRLLIINAMLDPKFSSKLTPIGVETLNKALTQNYPLDQVEKLFRIHFEGVTQIEVNEDSNGFRKVFFYGDDATRNLLVVWGVKDELFYDSNDLENVKNQIDGFVNSLSL